MPQSSAVLLDIIAEAWSDDTSPSLITGAVGTLAFEPAPIEPSWILTGSPVARIARHSTARDEAANTAIWDCTAGEFRWYFGWDETVYILEGQVQVTSADGAVKVLKPGDIAYFKGGTWATWKIDTHLRKIAFCRRPMPKPMALAYKLRNVLTGRGSRGL
jgi:uncharacterized cupin superfamily protein